jgi:multidrug efflux pump subunit AcrB
VTGKKASFITRIYRRGVDPFLDSRTKRWLLLGTVMLLLAVPLVLVVFRLVPLKMLPFDNKDELQIVIDLPEGTPLEATDGVVRAFEHYLGEQPEIVSFVSYVGQASPIDFNGLVRHYYLRRGGNLADIRINLAEKGDRSQPEPRHRSGHAQGPGGAGPAAQRRHPDRGNAAGTAGAGYPRGGDLRSFRCSL